MGKSRQGKVIKANQRGKQPPPPRESQDLQQEELFPGDPPSQGENGQAGATAVQDTVQDTVQATMENISEEPSGEIPDQISGANGGADGDDASRPGDGMDAPEQSMPSLPLVNLLANGPDGCFKIVDDGETVKLSEEEWRLELARIFKREVSPS